jgi:hypothetical protein
VTEFLRSVGDGTRVVIRYRLHDQPESATDAVGYVSGKNSTHIVVATVRGLTTIALADVIAAKEVPPPPVRGAAEGH